MTAVVRQLTAAAMAIAIHSSPRQVPPPVHPAVHPVWRSHLRRAQTGGISQAQDRLVLDVSRRGEQSCDLFGTENNGKSARLAGRRDLVDKIAAFQRDLEEEPQSTGSDVDVGTVAPIDRQPQLVPMNILRGGLVGRPAKEIRKAFDVADIVVLRLAGKPADRHVVDQPLAQGADSLVGH